MWISLKDEKPKVGRWVWAGTVGRARVDNVALLGSGQWLVGNGGVVAFDWFTHWMPRAKRPKPPTETRPDCNHYTKWLLPHPACDYGCGRTDEPQQCVYGAEWCKYEPRGTVVTAGHLVGGGLEKRITELEKQVAATVRQEIWLQIWKDDAIAKMVELEHKLLNHHHLLNSASRTTLPRWDE